MEGSLQGGHSSPELSLSAAQSTGNLMGSQPVGKVLVGRSGRSVLGTSLGPHGVSVGSAEELGIGGKRPGVRCDSGLRSPKRALNGCGHSCPVSLPPQTSGCGRQGGLSRVKSQGSPVPTLDREDKATSFPSSPRPLGGSALNEWGPLP